VGAVDGVVAGGRAEELGEGGLVMEEADVTIQALNALVNILIAGAAISGVVIAAMGLSTYKHQAQWSEERDLARKLLIKLKFREDGFKAVRNPFGYSHENDLDGEEVAERDQRWREVGKKYERRLAKLNQARSDFYPLAIEAEVYWGKVFVDLERELNNLEHDLGFAVDEFVESHNPRFEFRPYFDGEEESKVRGIVFALGSRDELGPKHQQAIENLTKFLKGRLV
jgi:hypothetical protein